jgi:hypothetical protein
MWVKSATKCRILGAVAAALVALLHPAPALAVDQNTSFTDTDVKNRKASDDSLQHSTVFAMSALMDLSNLNIPSAVNNGMTAYGKYRNSETLDKLGDLNLMRAGSLASVGSGVSGAPAGPTQTSFRRLDPGFLRKGKYGEIASEFERRSGMSRDKFLGHLSDVSEKKISRSDPQLMSKVFGRFENFVSQIPNPEFRGNLQKGVAMVPSSVRTGLVAKAVTRFSGIAGGASGANPSSDFSAASLAAAQTQPATDAAVANQPAAESGYIPVTGEEEQVAAAASSSPSSREPASMSLSRRLPGEPEHGSNPLGNIVQAALETQGQDMTIFERVSRRYRIVTPLVSKVP